jgi:hypothetical protein
MPAIVRTFTTRIDSHPALTARAKLESRIERKLYAALRSGREFTGDLAGLAFGPWPAADPDVVNHEHANLASDHPHLEGHERTYVPFVSDRRSPQKVAVS